MRPGWSGQSHFNNAQCPQTEHEGLAIKLLIARAYYAVRDFRATCAILNGVDHDITARSGERINSLAASQLLATTRAVEDALNCQ